MKSTNGDTMLGGEDFDEVLLKVRKWGKDDVFYFKVGAVCFL